MAVTNPLASMLFTNSPKAVDRVHRTVAAHPSAPIWWALALIILYVVLGVPFGNLVQPVTKPQAVSVWVLIPALLVVDFMVILVMNSLATWAINRQRRKSWGVTLLDEPRVLWFRPGIWVGTVTAYAIGIGVMLMGMCAAVLFPSLYQQIASSFSTVVGVMTLLYFSYAISYFYGIPRRLLVFRYVILPVVLISILGIVIAVVMGQYRNYEDREAQHESHHVVLPYHSPVPSLAVRQSAMDMYAALLRARVQDSVSMQNLTKGKPVEGTAVISLRLTPSGHLLSAHVAQSSGDAVINRDALKAVMSTRFPPFIQNMPAHPLTVNVSVHLSLRTEPTVPIARLQHAHHQPLPAPMNHSAGSPLLSSMIRKDDARCLAGFPLSAPWQSSGQVSATVVSFVSRRDVPIDIAWNNRTLHGMLAPVYISNQRVLVHPDGSSVGVTMLAVVSSGMRVTLGEQVQMASFHAFHRMPCTYVPNLIVDRIPMQLSNGAK